MGEHVHDAKTKAQNDLALAFAEKHRLRTDRDECGDVRVLGRYGHIYGWSPTEMAVYYEGGRWPSALADLEAVGARRHQSGSGCGAVRFDPGNKAQAKAAMAAIGARRKRNMTPELLANLERARVVAKSRREALEEGPNKP